MDEESISSIIDPNEEYSMTFSEALCMAYPEFSELHDWKEFRFTPYQDETPCHQRVVDLIQKFSQHFLIGYECNSKKNWHYHVAIFKPNEESSSFREEFHKAFPTRDGDNNRNRYKYTPIRKLEAIPYFIKDEKKDGTYLFITENLIEVVSLAKQYSYEKPKTMTELINIAREEYLDGQIDKFELARDIINARKMNLCYNRTKVTEIVNSLELTKHPELVAEEVSKIKYLS